MNEPAFQEQLSGNHCWGCGTLNEHGLGIRSRWSGGVAVCTWDPKPFHSAGPNHILNGGIIATIMDCHCVCTAIAAAYRAEGREIGTEPVIWYATGSMNLTYFRPTPVDGPVFLRALITGMDERKTTLACSLFAGAEKCVRAEIVAVRVRPAWWQASPAAHSLTSVATSVP